jgi:hypothetical protein
MVDSKNWVTSIDRFDNNIGYIIGNIRLICSEFNSAIGFTKEKFEIVLASIVTKYDL